MRNGLQAELTVGDALKLFIGWMLDDALAVLAGAAAVLERGRIPVGNAGQLVDAPTGQLTHALQIGLQMRQQIGWQIKRQQRLQLRIGGVEIGSVAIRHGMGCSALSLGQGMHLALIVCGHERLLLNSNIPLRS